MDLTREVLEREIEGAKAAIKAHQEGEAINKVVLIAFNAQLTKLPPKKKEEEKKPVGV